ncbi:MAG: nucleotidyltransferase domain-containing protein [Nanoarchaeota archaeon]
MEIKEFWKSWKNKSKIEKIAIESIYRAVDFLFESIPKEKIISVYIKGSFVTREMTRKSDVDILPILDNRKTMQKLKTIRNKNKDMLKPSELLPMSYTEFKQKNRSWGRADTFLRDLEHHAWIYGKKLSNLDYPMRKWVEMFEEDFIIL